MDELCPLCLKMGANSKIKAIQVNLDEALWMCENEECPWPFFGHDQPKFISRKVGEKWAYEWQTYRRVKERIGSVPVSIELSLYTPPVTPSADASTKDSMQSETAKNLTESSDNADIFSNNLSSRDSYAPRTATEVSFSSHNNSSAKNVHSAKIVPLQYEKDYKTVDNMLPSLPSIFDIDADKFLTNKISIKSCPNSVERIADVLNAGKSEAKINCVNSVLKSIPEPQTKTSPRIKQIIDGNSNNAARTEKSVKRPHIRSIARTTIDLQRFDPLKIVKIEKPDILEKLECPSTPPKQKSVENIPNPSFSPTQQTTTIKVDGIPPITLSYDLGNLGEQPEVNLPDTSKKCGALLQDNDHDNKLMAEIPKIQSKPSVKTRRSNGNNGKAFEKFSFSALKNVGKASNMINAPLALQCDPKLEEIMNRNQTTVCKKDFRSSVKDIVPSGVIANNSGFETVNPKVETFNSVNLDTNSPVVTESPAVDNLNLSCLIDDMILDGYQNATQNLNDDWLQSFFNEST